MSVTFLTNEDYQAILLRLQELETTINNAVKTETDPTVPSWAKQSTKPSYTASEVGADSSGTAAAKVSEHNTSDVSHNDIRLLITGLTNRLNTLANSDDTTLDQMSEVVAYIKSNKSLIEAITTSKVNVTDIIDNLTTNVSNKPLSAKQGVALKALIDNIVIPSKLSQFADDVGYAKQTDVDRLSEEIADQQNTRPYGIYHLDINMTKNPDDQYELALAFISNGESAKAGDLIIDKNLIVYRITNIITDSGIPYVISEKHGTLEEQDLSNYAKKATTLSGYGITDGATKQELNNLSQEINNQQTQINQKQPKGDYALKSELTAEVTAREQAIASLNARLGQQTVCIAEGTTQEEAEAWLETNGDKTKVYLMPDDTFWLHKETTEVIESGGIAYTNLLPTAVDTDGSIFGEDYNGDGVNDGYKKPARLSGSSGNVSTSTGDFCASGFMSPLKEGDVIRLKNTKPQKGVSAYLITYNDTTKVAYKELLQDDTGTTWANNAAAPWQHYDAEQNILTLTVSSENFGTGFNRFRISGVFTDETIITINEEIKESSGTTTVIVEKWVTTGHGLVATNYDAIIATITNAIDAHTEEIQALKELVKSGTPLEDDEKLSRIREWDAPIYDSLIPVFQLTTEKTAKTSATNTPDAIYAMYDALMAKYPRYITKTDLGVCSDGVNHVYRYDFREPEPYHQSNMPWSETKTKAILVSGIHFEWAGIYGLYYALEEITENPDLYDLRRNTHFIVIPVLNPYCTIVSNYNASIGVLNANGVQIHRNFEVGFIYPGESGYQEFGTRNHGGTEPLSEMETQCLDNIFKENTDAAFFLTCHNFDSPSETNGLGFIWASSATKYMCNMGYRLADKMTKAWLDKWGDELEEGIADYRTDNVTDDFIRLGHAHMSLTDGTETRQATKYGIQGNNVEICHTFYPHGTKANVEPSMSSFTLSRGAETYINFLLTACGVYDYKDKEQYYK